VSGWRPALRVARRELWRAKARTALVLVMVLLPVTGVSAMSTLLHTADIDVVEGLPASLGSAQARLDPQGGRVEQDPLLRNIVSVDQAPAPTPDQVRAALPPGSRVLEVREGQQRPAAIALAGHRVRVSLVGADLTDASLRGPYAVVQGRAPAAADEVAVTPDLARKGVQLGSRIDAGAGPRVVTAIVHIPSQYGGFRTVLGLPTAVGLEKASVSHYWVSGPAVTWTTVQRLNTLGVGVLSRAVVTDPPHVTGPKGFDDGRRTTLAIIALIAVMAVLEVVLLAGPAFAVGARRQRRGLALMAAAGAEPRHVRRVVLAQGLLIGGTAAVAGVPLGVAIAAVARRPLTAWAGATWGPFDVAPRELALIALLGAGTALLAAVLPAIVMGRQPIVAALQGRRITSAGAGRPALLGLCLLTIGGVLTLVALKRPGRFGGYSELGIAAAAIPTVLGAVLLAPAALALVGRSAARLPLSLRFAVRDVDRQRGRTAPAVAAIAATVASVVALGTASGSDAAQQRADYRPSGPVGAAVISTFGTDADWTALAAAASHAVPAQPIHIVRGLPSSLFGPQQDGADTETQICRTTELPEAGRCFALIGDTVTAYGTDLLVGPGSVEAMRGSLAPGGVELAEQELARGQVLVASPNLQPGEHIQLRRTRFDRGPDGSDRSVVLATVDAVAARLPAANDVAPARAVIPESLAAKIGTPRTVALLVGHDLTRQAEARLRTEVQDVDDGVSVQVERGYQSSGDRTVLLVLALIAGVLVLGGTLAATSLALSEARPDLVTIGQVGARPRTRRLVAGGYALVVGAVGAVLGVAAGLVPGIAAAIPLTSASRGSSLLGSGPAADTYVIDIPFMLLALVLVVLPLISAAVAAASVRQTLPSARRLSG
jgi:putative ABC transport system permease protein